MSRIIAILGAFGVVGLALYADRLEVSSPSLGSLLWIGALFFGIALLFWQANRARVTPLVALVALIPYLNLVLIPLVTIVLAFKPVKNHKKI